jgi:hypothetical protein
LQRGGKHAALRATPGWKSRTASTAGRRQVKRGLQKSLDKLMTEKIINSKKKTTILEYYDPFFAKVSGSDPRINPAGERIQSHEDVRRASGFIKKASLQPQELI